MVKVVKEKAKKLFNISVTFLSLPVRTDCSGDGDGVFYLQGGQVMPQPLLEECLKFSEDVSLNSFTSN